MWGFRAKTVKKYAMGFLVNMNLKISIVHMKSERQNYYLFSIFILIMRVSLWNRDILKQGDNLLFITIHSQDRREQIYETTTHYWYPGTVSLVNLNYNNMDQWYFESIRRSSIPTYSRYLAEASQREINFGAYGYGFQHGLVSLLEGAWFVICSTEVSTRFTCSMFTISAAYSIYLLLSSIYTSTNSHACLCPVILFWF